MKPFEQDWIIRFHRGSGPMGSDFIDYYEEDGKYLRHHWGMGGEDLSVVVEIPDCIEGYMRNKRKEGK